MLKLRNSPAGRTGWLRRTGGEYQEDVHRWRVSIYCAIKLVFLMHKKVTRSI